MTPGGMRFFNDAINTKQFLFHLAQVVDLYQYSFHLGIFKFLYVRFLDRTSGVCASVTRGSLPTVSTASRSLLVGKDEPGSVSILINGQDIVSNNFTTSDL